MKYVSRFTVLILTLVVILAMPFSVFAQDGGENGKAVFGDSYRLKSGETLDGALAVFGGEATIEDGARVNGDVAVIGGTVTVGGTINGDVAVFGGTVIMQDTGVINGDVIKTGGNLVNPDAGQINGNVVNGPTSLSVPLPERFPTFRTIRPAGDTAGQILFGLLISLVFAGVALVIGLIAPKPTQRVATTITSQPVVSGAMGLLTAFVYPVMLVILAITIILSPISLLGMVLLAAALGLGLAALGLEVGNRLSSATNSNWSLPVSAGVGTLLLSFLAFVVGVIPCMSFVAWVLISLFGVGGVVMSRFGTQVYARNGTLNYQPPPSSPASPEPPTPPAPPAAALQPANPPSESAGSEERPFSTSQTVMDVPPAPESDERPASQPPASPAPDTGDSFSMPPAGEEPKE